MSHDKSETGWTFFIVEDDGNHGTTFVTHMNVYDLESARIDALDECADAWDTDVSNLRTLGVAKGQVELIEWDDNN